MGKTVYCGTFVFLIEESELRSFESRPKTHGTQLSSLQFMIIFPPFMIIELDNCSKYDLNNGKVTRKTSG